MDVLYKFNSGRLFTANDWYKNKLKVNKTTLNLLEGKIKKQIKIMSLSLTLSTISPTGTAQKMKDFSHLRISSVNVQCRKRLSMYLQSQE